MFNKIKVFNDKKVYMVILMDDIEALTVLTEAIVSIGKKGLSYEVYKDDITAYMMEMRMTYNRYMALMTHLRKHGYTLCKETKVGIFSRMKKIGL